MNNHIGKHHLFLLDQERSERVTAWVATLYKGCERYDPDITKKIKYIPFYQGNTCSGFIWIVKDDDLAMEFKLKFVGDCGVDQI